MPFVAGGGSNVQDLSDPEGSQTVIGATLHISYPHLVRPVATDYCRVDTSPL